MSQANPPAPTPAAPTPDPRSAPTRIPAELVVMPRSRWGSRLLWMGLFLCLALLMQQQATLHRYFDTTGGITEKYRSGPKWERTKIAVIQVTGVILDGEGFAKRQIDRVMSDPDVKGIVLRVDSPGGTVTGADYILHHLQKLREERGIPLVVSMGSIAASGGYYVSMAVGDEQRSIYAEPTTTTGSIGVIVPHYDITGLMDQYHIRDDSIVSHPRKQMLSMTKEMSEEERELMQSYVMETFERFKRIVQDGRPGLRNDKNELVHEGRDLATGEIFTAEQAKKFGLVDELGFIEDAVARCAELVNLDPEQVRVVEYERPASLLPFSAAAQSHAQSSLTDLLQLSTPRAYYLATTLPLLMHSPRE